MKTDPVLGSIQEYIKSGEYFISARKWYKEKYLKPFSQRSMMFVCSCTFCLLLIGIAVNVSSLFPLSEQVRYSLNVRDASQSSAIITRADYIEGDPLASIADIMVRGYVLQREKYDYDMLQQQFTFVKNTSNRLTYRKFYNTMNIDNLESPILRYQREVRRSVVKVLSSKYTDNNEITITFESLAKSTGGDVVENKIWEAIVGFDIDDIDISVPSETKFNFIVTNYRLKQLVDKQQK